MSRFACNGVVQLEQTMRMHTPAAKSGRKTPASILVRLVFCQALSGPARRPPPDLCYLPSLSFYPRQHLETLQCRTVSYDRPSLHTVDVALCERMVIEHYDVPSYAVRSRLRFVCKRRLHQGSIESQTRCPGSPATEWWAPILRRYYSTTRPISNHLVNIAQIIRYRITSRPHPTEWPFSLY